MVLTALRGALGFLTRLPVGASEAGWDAFRTTPATFPLVGYLVGGLAGLALAAPVPPATAAAAYLVVLLALTGITHADGLADLGDAAAVHADPERRREVLKDTTLGVGGAVALAVAVVALALGAVQAAALPWRQALALAVVAEVAGKLSMAGVACLGDATHEGLGSQLTEPLGGRDFLGPTLVALPAAVLTVPSLAGAVGLLGGLAAAALVGRWATRALGGVNGDVIGAVNEVARLAALHAGVVAWTRF